MLDFKVNYHNVDLKLINKYLKESISLREIEDITYNKRYTAKNGQHGKGKHMHGKNGADIINDISAGDLDENMFSVISRYNVPYIIMHMLGNPRNMQKKPI